MYVVRMCTPPFFQPHPPNPAHDDLAAKNDSALASFRMGMSGSASRG